MARHGRVLLVDFKDQRLSQTYPVHVGQRLAIWDSIGDPEGAELSPQVLLRSHTDVPVGEEPFYMCAHSCVRQNPARSNQDLREQLEEMREDDSGQVAEEDEELCVRCGRISMLGSTRRNSCCETQKVRKLVNGGLELSHTCVGKLCLPCGKWCLTCKCGFRDLINKTFEIEDTVRDSEEENSDVSGSATARSGTVVGIKPKLDPECDQTLVTDVSMTESCSTRVGPKPVPTGMRTVASSRRALLPDEQIGTQVDNPLHFEQDEELWPEGTARLGRYMYPGCGGICVTHGSTALSCLSGSDTACGAAIAGVATPDGMRTPDSFTCVTGDRPNPTQAPVFCTEGGIITLAHGSWRAYTGAAINIHIYIYILV